MICIIPARGGSKRIPRKNIKPFLGRPIIEYPIATAINCGYDVIVSTEDVEIAGVAMGAGAEVTYRPVHLTGDAVELEEVLYDLLVDRDEIAACMMLPTSVFINSDHLDIGEELLAAYSLVYSVVPFEYPIERSLEIVDGRVQMTVPDYRNSQDIPVRYHDAGQFYIFRVAEFIEAWDNGKRLLDLDAKGMIYKRSEVQDIDTEEDWKIAEMKYQARGM
jgi:N-acylneuraminate cytidylyltransferase